MASMRPHTPPVRHICPVSRLRESSRRSTYSAARLELILQVPLARPLLLYTYRLVDSAPVFSPWQANPSCTPLASIPSLRSHLRLACLCPASPLSAVGVRTPSAALAGAVIRRHIAVRVFPATTCKQGAPRPSEMRLADALHEHPQPQHHQA
ncbi:hypothetical protein BD413DRAFT_306971 [Trametes elegans]|nr:hypothetical protein BD413DRAFT_306971 [Trametes elegans]